MPTANADSFTDGSRITFSGTPEKNGETFGHLMAQALSPASPKKVNPVAEQTPPGKIITPDVEKRKVFLNKLPQLSEVQNKPAENLERIETGGGDFQLQSKNSKSTTQASDKNQQKIVGGNVDIVAIPPLSSEASVVPVVFENISIPIFAAVIATTGKSGLSAETTADISVADAKTVIAGKSGGVSTTLPEIKKLSALDVKIPIPVISQDQPGIKANSTVKTDSPQKITVAVEALTEKVNSTSSKIAGTTMTNPQVLPLVKGALGDLMTPKPAVESIVQSPQSEFSAKPDLTVKTTAQPQPDINGTSVAQQDVPMTKMEKPNKIAGSAGKILPGAAVSSTQANNLSDRKNISVLAARAGQMAATITASSPDRVPEVAQPSGDPVNSIVNASIADVRSRGLERVQDMVVLHAARLSDSGNNLLQVVIKPGAGTQLSLELRQRGDGVEATAVLQRGDFGHLNQQWPALQQQLEQRGIRLAPLVADGNFAGNGENNFQQKQNRSAESDSVPDGAFAEVAPTGSFAQSTALMKAHRGWETWA
ncbi:MAG TPA: hypothetical protein VHY30_10600 [Verrucomicrobiae bacterium]|nr:hypothetical protein [Verrucomicrobiae bacterium]